MTVGVSAPSGFPAGHCVVIPDLQPWLCTWICF